MAGMPVKRRPSLKTILEGDKSQGLLGPFPTYPLFKHCVRVPRDASTGIESDRLVIHNCINDLEACVVIRI
jgi:hypothetical protein